MSDEQGEREERQAGQAQEDRAWIAVFDTETGAYGPWHSVALVTYMALERAAGFIGSRGQVATTVFDGGSIRGTLIDPALLAETAQAARKWLEENQLAEQDQEAGSDVAK